MSDQTPDPRARWRLRAQGFGLAVLLLVLLLFVRYWPGRAGWLAQFGRDSGIFDFSSPQSYPLTSPREDIPGITNFAQVSRNLYRGAAVDRIGLIALKQMGVRTIIDLRETQSDVPALDGLGMWLAPIPVNPSEIEAEEVAEFLRMVRNPDYQPMFVHCRHGSDRTGVMVAIYRVMEQEWPVEQAALELPRFGFNQVWVPLLQYLKTMDRAHLNALAATGRRPGLIYVP